MFTLLTVFNTKWDINMLKLIQFYRGCFILILSFVQCQLIECIIHQGNIVKRMDMDIATCLGIFHRKSIFSLKTKLIFMLFIFLKGNSM